MKLSPGQAITLRGLQKKWVAGQLGISPSYLSMLLGGERSWTPELSGKFPLVVGLASDTICFAQGCTAIGQSVHAECADVAAEALDSSPERGDGPSEYSDTSTPAKAPQSAELAAVRLPATEAAR